MIFSKERARPKYFQAGIFSSWLRRTRTMLAWQNGVKVPCRKCKGCCTSSYFIHIRPEESLTLAHIPKKYLLPAPYLPKGNMVLGYDKNGHCPMLLKGRCSIYKHRPLTCRNYDCRIFSAAGIAADDDNKALINKQVLGWRFSYPAKNDRIEHSAVKMAAKFIWEHAEYFPRGEVPQKAFQLAILAIKVHDVFLRNGCTSSRKELAKKIIEANHKFGKRPSSAIGN